MSYYNIPQNKQLKFLERTNYIVQQKDVEAYKVT